MPDLPDWYQGFQLVGSDITINVNIEASGVTLPIDIAAVTADLDVTIEAVDVTIDINFTDQSVAVWGAAAWFSRQGEQIFINGEATFEANGSGTLASRTVPTGKTFYIAGFAWGCVDYADIIGTAGELLLAGSYVISAAAKRGAGVVLDVPIRAAAGEVVILGVKNAHTAAQLYRGGFWGWDEED